LHVVDNVCHTDPEPSPLNPNAADEQPCSVFLMGKDMLDLAAYLGTTSIGPFLLTREVFAWFAAEISGLAPPSPLHSFQIGKPYLPKPSLRDCCYAIAQANGRHRWRRHVSPSTSGLIHDDGLC